MSERPSVNWSTKAMSRPSVWLLIVLFLLITIFQYSESFDKLAFLARLTANLGLTRYALERILYLLPIIWAGALFGWKGGIIVALITVATMLPRDLLYSPNPEDALVETIAIFVVGSLAAFSLESLRKERQRRSELELVQQELQSNIQALKESEERLSFFLEQVVKAQEEERRRIAQELHDDTVQALVVHCQDIDNLASSTKGIGGEPKLLLEGLHQQANRIMQEVRRLSQDLRPATLDNLGLVPAIEWLVSDVAQYSGVATKLKVLGVERRLPDEVELVLFRIVQEALRNIWKHAQATSVEITLEFFESRIRVSIEDDGKGFEHPPVVSNFITHGKLGLAGMQERTSLLGGTFTITSEPGRGTNLSTELPL